MVSSRTLLFSGAFDPITNAHILMLELCIQSAYFDQIWIMPSGKRTDKVYKASDNDRLKMCQIVADLYDRESQKLIVTDFELKLDRTIDTYFTIIDLQKNYPGLDFYFFLGTDILPSMFSWPYAEELVGITKFLIAIREGYGTNEQDLQKLKEYILLEDLLKAKGLNHPTSELSSTIARNQLSHGQDCEALGTLHPKVMDWIRENRLYNAVPDNKH